MSDQRITQLTSLAQGDVADNDVLPIVDIGASQTKKITVKDLTEAGFALADADSLDLEKLNQQSTTKLGTSALALNSVTASILADNSSIVTDSVEPTSNNFKGKGYLNSTTKNLKIWDGTAYAQVVAPSEGIATSAVTTDKIAANAVTTGKIDTGGLAEAALATNAVTTTKIADNAVTTAKLSTGAVTTDKLAQNSVTAAVLADNSVDTAAIADSAVTAAELATNAVTTVKIQAGAVTNDKIANTTIAYAKLNLSDGEIPGAKLTGASVTSTQISANAIANAQIINAAVTTAKIADDAITADKLATDSVTADAIATGAVGTTELGANTVTYAKFQQTSSADVLLGRQSTGAGNIEEIACTAAGRALLSNTNIIEQRATLGLGTLATQNGTFSGTHSGTSSGTNTGDQTISLTGDVTGSGTESIAATISDDAITTAKIATGAITTTELASSAVTGPKLAADSSTVVSGNAPTGTGEFEGQQWLNINTGLTYVWTGSEWLQSAAVQTISFSDSTPLVFSVTKPNLYTAEITTSLENQTAGKVLAGPESGSASTPTFRSLVATDLPIATSGVNGAVQPGTGLTVNGSGVLNHLNTVGAGTYTKITVDAQGHVTSGNLLAADDIPVLDAGKIQSGTFGSAFLAPNSVTATQLADNGIAHVGESQPIPEFSGQWWINPSDRSAYIWVGTVSPVPNGYWLLVGYGSPSQLNARFGGTYNATTNQVLSLNEYGVQAGLVVGQPLSAPNTQNNAVYLIVTTGGTGVTPAPAASLAVGDWVLSQGTGSNWTKVAVVSGASGTFNDYEILCNGTYFDPDMSSVSNVRDAFALVWSRIQVATSTQSGRVLASDEVLVNATTGSMSIGTVDDGTY